MPHTVSWIVGLAKLPPTTIYAVQPDYITWSPLGALLDCFVLLL